MIFLLLSQISLAAENRRYIRVGENPVNPGLVLEGEKVFPVERDTLLTTLDKGGRKHTGWLSDDYHFVGQKKNGQWEAVRIYECGNPILRPRIILREKGLFNPQTNCALENRDWLVWTVGPGLIGYGGGVRKGLPAGLGSGVLVIDLVGRPGIRKWDCRMMKRTLIGLASAGIGWLIGDALYKPENQTNRSGAYGSGGPGPVPPNGVAMRF